MEHKPMNGSAKHTKRNGSRNAVLPLPSLIRASAWDAGNQSMRAAGRQKWSDDDYNAAVRCQDRLIAACYGSLPEGYIRFSVAEALQKAGALHMGMSADEFFATIDAAMQ